MRNKIYFAQEMPLEQGKQCAFINAGKILSLAYEEDKAKFEKESGFDSASYFREVFDSKITAETTRIVFTNLGMLLEKEFALDVPRFLLEYAKDFQVFVVDENLRMEDEESLVWNVGNPKDRIEFQKGVVQRA